MNKPRQTTESSCLSAAKPIRERYRIRFAKAGLLRWTSHRDLARLWERIVRRANLTLSMTEGFHPKPRIAFPSALALGVNGYDEVVELELAERMPVTDLFDRLCNDNQPGLTINSVKRLPEGFGKAQLSRSDYVITVPDTVDLDAVQAAIVELKTKDSVSFQRKNKTLTVDMVQIPFIQIVGNQLHLALAASQSASLRPGDVLELIAASDWVPQGAVISRTRVVLQKEYDADTPDRIATQPTTGQPTTDQPTTDQPTTNQPTTIASSEAKPSPATS